ncbi:hypothetical protein [Naasia lichenicola]|uniref:Uncharacterized protein n=1 Tax=Naasia lichenicola TaxID=2565933 RepID=A0A4S4FQY5_9MICO|nr:hypothetical protein [Naasia lichenicola]THG33000.1 hypothetical protein E6C64_01145 [Naasia lichenicola]
MTQCELSPGVIGIIEHLARWARGYDNHLKWNEQAKFKADLMNVRERWQGVDVDAFRSRCLSEGMRTVDVDELVGWLQKAQAGRRLVPPPSYRGFRFTTPVDDPGPLRTSEDWSAT